MDNQNPLSFTISAGRRLVLFLCITVVCYVICAGAMAALVYFKGQTTPVMRIAAVVQDIFLFIIPAIVTAIMVTRLPARFLCIDTAPNRSVVGMACLAIVAALPAMNALVAWNESISLPAAMADVEAWMRSAEVAARESIAILIGQHNVMSLVMSILIVGVLAALAEELFFRGALQRLLSSAGLNAHVAIWLAAFIFSATHMQFYGFFGRLLLGAYFGYLLWWSRCLWVPVAAHFINNTLYLVGNYAAADAMPAAESKVADAQSSAIDTIGTQGDWLMVAVSIVLTAAIIIYVRHLCKRGGNRHEW